jgi:hypothetical protein
MTLPVDRLAEAVPGLSDEEKWAYFDQQAQTFLGMSGEEFVRQYRAGRWPDPDADPNVMYLVTLLPAAR